MTIVGFNLTKIFSEKKESVKGKINITNNVSVKNVESTDLSLGAVSQQNGLRIDFVFQTKYEPNMGEITLEGNILFMSDEKKTKEILDNWKKTKQMPKEVMLVVLNTVLQRCNIEALVLSKELNLPPPIQLPKVTAKEAGTQMPPPAPEEPQKKAPEKKKK